MVHLFLNDTYWTMDNWTELVHSDYPPVGTVAYNDKTCNWLTVVPFRLEGDRMWDKISPSHVPKQLRLRLLVLTGIA